MFKVDTAANDGIIFKIQSSVSLFLMNFTVRTRLKRKN